MKNWTHYKPLLWAYKLYIPTTITIFVGLIIGYAYIVLTNY